MEQAELVSGNDPTGPNPWKMRNGMLVGLIVGAVVWWTNHLSGAGLFHNLHLLILPMVAGALLTTLRNSWKQVGVYHPKIVTENKKGRV